jgi:hypothetical protein
MFRIRIVSACALVGVLISLTGCAPRRDDLVELGVMRLATVPEKRGHYRDIHVYQVDNAIRVTGYVRRSTRSAHVHVAVQDPAGRTIEEVKAPVRRVPRSSRVRHARFDAMLPVPASGVTVVRIRHHVGQCKDSGLSGPGAGADLKGSVP